MKFITKFKSLGFVISILLALTTSSLAAKRVALVLGVGDYKNTQALRNPVKDTQSVAAALRSAGFDVTLATDGKQKPEVVTSMAQEFYFINPQVTINNNLTIDGEASSISISVPEARATALLVNAREMRTGKDRVAALELVRQQYPDTISAKSASLMMRNTNHLELAG